MLPKKRRMGFPALKLLTMTQHKLAELLTTRDSTGTEDTEKIQNCWLDRWGVTSISRIGCFREIPYAVGDALQVGDDPVENG
jgi:hypothetical protein